MIYKNYGITLTSNQIKKLKRARDSERGVTLTVSKNNLNGNMQLPLTQTQINKIMKANKAVQLTLSKTQISHMEKTGGFIPLLALIPIIASALGAAGGVAGGVASAVNSSRQTAELARHNREVENIMKSGTGVISNAVEPIPVIGKTLSNLLKKIGLGQCKVDGLRGLKFGEGLYLERQGAGPFLAR